MKLAKQTLWALVDEKGILRQREGYFDVYATRTSARKYAKVFSVYYKVPFRVARITVGGEEC